jgi:uncharacterized repeat protein (TIGR03803 family)
MKSTLAARQHAANSVHLARSVKRPAARRVWLLTLAALLGLAAAVAAPAAAQTFKVLHSFAGYPKDGGAPLGGLLMDSAGNLYGTTLQGGKYSGCEGLVGCGTVFKLDANGVETVLHNFNGSDGAGSSATLIMDANGDLYGTAAVGGGSGCNTGGSVGCGVVFKLSGHKETVLYRFTGGADGAFPWAGLVMDARGSFYGTTNAGGEYGGGVVFKLAGTNEAVLHAFTGGKDGSAPGGGTLVSANGSLYGTAASGGDMNCNPDPCGVVFKLIARKETVLHAFKGSPDGAFPAAGLFMDATGNLYGTTGNGGHDSNGGIVFEVGQDGKKRELHTFRGAHGGSDPQAGVVLDAQGNLYGTTLYGPTGTGGTAFEITADGKEKILHYFCSEKDCADGGIPNDLIIDAKGNLYGTTYGGGINGNGVIFMITP